MINQQSSATAILAALQNNSVTAQDMLEMLAPAHDRARELGAFIDADLDAPSQAIASDRRRDAGEAGPLDGLPISVKDNIYVSGAPSSGATPQLRDFVGEEGPGIARLRRAGAVFTDKTNLHELAFGVTGANAWTGVVRNPFDTARLSGGSSSGAAVSVAVGACAIAVASDTGGSSRVPAALCGVVGFRPTFARYPTGGTMDLTPSRDTIGLIARTVGDVALADGVIMETSGPLPEVAIGLTTLGVVRVHPIDPAVAGVFEGTLELLRGAGVRLVERDLSEAAAANDACGFAIALYETKQSLEKVARSVLDIDIANFVAGIASSDVRELLASQLGQDAVPDAVYRDAVEVHLPRLRAAMAEALVGVDALIYPTTPITAPPLDHGDTLPVGEAMVPVFPAFTAMTSLDSMAGVPSISLPVGLAGGLPVGVQLTGAAGSDLALLALAQAVEAVLPSRPVPGLASPSASSGHLLDAQ